MKKRIFASLLALALLVSLAGCGAVLSAWKEVMGGNEPPPPGSSGPSAPASSAPEPSARPSLPGGERPSTPDPLKEPESSEPIPLEELMLERLRDEIRASSNTVGVAFLGYVDSDSSEVDLRDYMYQSELGSTYYFLPMKTRRSRSMPPTSQNGENTQTIPACPFMWDYPASLLWCFAISARSTPTC